MSNIKQGLSFPSKHVSKNFRAPSYKITDKTGLGKVKDLANINKETKTVKTTLLCTFRSHYLPLCALISNTSFLVQGK